MKTRKALEDLAAYPVLPVVRRGKIRLDLNESTRGCSPRVLEALSEITWEDVGAYPDYHLLKARIAALHRIAPENLLLSNGADDGIRAIMQTYIDQDDEVVLAEPSFGMIQIHARVMGAAIRAVPYRLDLSFPAAGFRAALSPRTRLICIVRPDSPSGAVISREELGELLQAAPHALVMLDETYYHFLGETLLEWIRDHPNLLIVQSFSKAFCLAGMRCGLVAGHPQLIRDIGKVNPPFALNNLAVRAALAALEDLSYVKAVVEDIHREKSWLIGQFKQRGLAVRDSAANFVLVRFGETAQPVQQALLEGNILIKNLDSTGLLKGYCRIAIGTREENQILLKAVDDLLE